jgi:anti-sigma B factor antagonist
MMIFRSEQEENSQWSNRVHGVCFELPFPPSPIQNRFQLEVFLLWVYRVEDSHQTRMTEKNVARTRLPGNRPSNPNNERPTMATSPTPDAVLELNVEKNGDQTIVRGTGRITAATTEHFQSTIRGIIPDTKRIVLDLTGVDYIDSSGLGALVSVYMAAGRAQCELELANPKPRVRDLLNLTKVSSIFENHQFGGL